MDCVTSGFVVEGYQILIGIGRKASFILIVTFEVYVRVLSIAV